MQCVVEKLGERAGVDPYAKGTYMKVKNPPYMSLVIENNDGRTISVTHYFILEGDLVPDPDMVFLVEGKAWSPMSYQNQMVYTEAMHYGEDGRLRINPRAVRDLRSFANTWATNLKQQGFLTAEIQTEP
jgi:hypothetical protein